MNFCRENSHVVNFRYPKLSVDVTLPKNCSYLGTIYIRVALHETSLDDIKKIIGIIWECLSIFKENFPSKVELFQEKLDSFVALSRAFTPHEMLRRQVSTL